MAYLFVFLAVFSNAAKGYCSKRVSGQLQTVRENFTFNAARNFVCTIFALALVLLQSPASVLPQSFTEIALCLLSGFTMAAFAVCWTLALRTDAYMLVSASGSAAFVVPCIIGLTVFQERFTYFKLLAFVCIMVALYFLVHYNILLKGKITKGQFALLLLILLTNGTNQATQKLYLAYVHGRDASCYTLYTYGFAFLLLLLLRLFLPNPPQEMRRPIIRSNLKYLAVMAPALFGASYFQTLAAAQMDAVILYPLSNALNLIAGSTMATLFFKEKMRKSCVVGIILVFIALVCSRF